ncbi:insulinase family protein [Paenimyroides ceti]|uniref:insulinase family protein n=1 Tax=Paenimyroides ceti TaxID=395087 RepID=UPI0037C8479B
MGILSVDTYQFPKNWNDSLGKKLQDAYITFEKFYVPNNAVLVIAGDIDYKQTKDLVQKYFGNIKKGAKVERVNIRKIRLQNQSLLNIRIRTSNYQCTSQHTEPHLTKQEMPAYWI